MYRPTSPFFNMFGQYYSVPGQPEPTLNSLSLRHDDSPFLSPIRSRYPPSPSGTMDCSDEWDYSHNLPEYPDPERRWEVDECDMMLRTEPFGFSSIHVDTCSSTDTNFGINPSAPMSSYSLADDDDFPTFSTNAPVPKKGKKRAAESSIPRSTVPFLSLNMDREEIDTEKLSEFLLAEMHALAISQNNFAAKVLGKSQGTFSELVKRPKKWCQIKNTGRETYKKMFDWLCLGHEERMQALEGPVVKKKKKRESKEHRPRIVFSDQQRSRLMAIFQENKHPSPMAVMKIANDLGLPVYTVDIFFTNTRRRFRENKENIKN
ncbi:unnamed protein product [Caenorhabditis sp. 36 PRJEB53466]|nr:unnamed protein product [Caenorhabditis sp. 36 PRJEB53466]